MFNLNCTSRRVTRRSGILRAGRVLRAGRADCVHADFVESLGPHLLALLPSSPAESARSWDGEQGQHNGQAEEGEGGSREPVNCHINRVVALLVVTQNSSTANPFAGVLAPNESCHDDRAEALRELLARVEVENSIDGVRLSRLLGDAERLPGGRKKVTRSQAASKGDRSTLHNGWAQREIFNLLCDGHEMRGFHVNLHRLDGFFHRAWRSTHATLPLAGVVMCE